MFDIDTGAVRHLAGRLADRAEEIRQTAGDLARQVADVPWQGLAADGMRGQAQLRLVALAQVADLHDAAATALGRHADAVDTTTGLVDGVVDGVVDRALDLIR